MNILFLCTANLNRSKTAEDFYRIYNPNHNFMSAGLSLKYCQKLGTRICTTQLLNWSDMIFVMEDVHKLRIAKYAGEHYLKKVEVLYIEDVYRYMDSELICKLTNQNKLRFLKSDS